MASETIVAVFRSTADAEAVAHELRAAGVSASAIEMHSAADHVSDTDATLAHPANEKKSGMWSWLTGDDDYESDRAIYDRTLSTGGVALSVIVAEADSARVMAIIEKHDPVDLDTHSMTSTTTATSGVAATTATAAMATGATAARTTTATGARDGEVLSLAEEQLQVGKRTVQGGTAKIRRYVVERPVEEQIRLRSETLKITRRPVTGDGRVAADAFTEKTIEFRETKEEAVVGKTARVVEEVLVGKEATERVETVRDTVRKEEVEIVGAQSGVNTTTTRTGTTNPVPPAATPKH